MDNNKIIGERGQVQEKSASALSTTSKSNQAGQKLPRPAATGQRELSERQIQDQFNQLVSEVRILESYYQEVLSRQQSVSEALIDTRGALDAIETLSKSEKNDLLVPLGGGTFIFAENSRLDKLVVSVGAGVAIEKSKESAQVFLKERRQELERAASSLENQRKEIGSRLEVGRATIQRITGAQQ